MNEDAQMIRRILEHFDRASAADLAAGLEWYDRAESAAKALTTGTNLTLNQTAGIIAALSPRVQWQNNLNAAASMVKAAQNGRPEPIVAGLGANRAKAWRIAKGADPSDVLGGPKVTAFHANISGNHEAVTVDVWAARAAEGEDNPNAPKGKRYERIANAYRRAAAARNVSPRTMQATVWAHIRGHAYGNFKRSSVNKNLTDL